MRVFLGIPVPAFISEKLNDFSLEHKGKIRGSWVRKENYHITIFFIGEKSENEVEEIKTGLFSVFKNKLVFETAICGYSAFPSKNNVKVLYSAVDDKLNNCRELFNAAASVCGAEESRYIPHITVARFYKKPPFFPVEVWRRKSELYFTVDRIILYKSVPGKNGAVYSPISEFKLTGDS